MALEGQAYDLYKPSLFELLATSQLQALIPPSLQFLLRSATQRYPKYLLQIFNRYDELYAFLSFLIEGYYLRTYSSSFVEHFYSLKRSRVPQFSIPLATQATPSIVRETLRLRRRDIRLSLAALVLLPYIKRKLEASYEKHNARNLVLGNSFRRAESLPSNASLSQRIQFAYRWFLTSLYPPIHAASGAATLAFSLLYLFDGAKSHNPLLWLAGIRMERLGAEDWVAFEAAERKSSQVSSRSDRAGLNASRRFLSLSTLRQLGPASLRSLKLLLPAAVFALKFLEWWHASDFASQLSRKRAENLDLPLPDISVSPEAPQPSSHANAIESGRTESGRQSATTVRKAPVAASSRLPILTVPVPTSESSHLCPICSAPIVAPTACQTGYVFCYTCIFKWIEGEHDRQVAFMQGGKDEAGWGDEEGDRSGKWESGAGRCAITGLKVLGGSSTLRRVMI